MDDISNLLLNVVQFFQNGNFSAVLLTSFLTTIAIRAYRMPQVQDRLPDRLKWDKGILAWIIVGAVGIIVSAFMGMVTGTPFVMALTQAIPLFCNFIVASGMIHKVTESVANSAVVQEKTPEVVKQVSSLVFPFPVKKE